MTNFSDLCRFFLWAMVGLLTLPGLSWSESGRYPPVLGDFRRVSEAYYPTPELGSVGRYTGDASRQQVLDVFVYPVPTVWREPGSAALTDQKVLQGHFQQLLNELDAVAREASGRSVRVTAQGLETLDGLSELRWALIEDQRGDTLYYGALLLTIDGEAFVKLRSTQLEPVEHTVLLDWLQRWLSTQVGVLKDDTLHPDESPAL